MQRMRLKHIFSHFSLFHFVFLGMGEPSEEKGEAREGSFCLGKRGTVAVNATLLLILLKF